MGWLWGAQSPTKSSSQDSAHREAQQSGVTNEAHAQEKQSSIAPTEHNSQTQAQPSPSDESDTDPEMRFFLQEVMCEVKSMRDADAAAAAAKSPDSTTNDNKITVSPWGSRWASTSMPDQTAQASSQTTTEDPDNPSSAPRLSPLAESLLPTTMNCETAFNHAFHCRSLGGQFTALYRYGTVRSCNEQWNDFWFCMRAKGFAEGKVKEDAIRDHYRQKELAKYGSGMPSSEDVWRERRERLPRGEAFAMPVEMPVTSDAEFQKWEMERKDRIRKGLKGQDG